MRRLIAGILCICMIFQLPVQSVGVYANKGEISEKPNSVVSEKTSITEETIEETKRLGDARKSPRYDAFL